MVYLYEHPNRTVLGWREGSHLPGLPLSTGDTRHGTGWGGWDRVLVVLGIVLHCPCSLQLCFGVQQIRVKSSKRLVPHHSGRGGASPGTWPRRKAPKGAVGRPSSLV